MTTTQSLAKPSGDVNPSVFNDTLALASHMSDCQRSQGPFFRVRTLLDSLRSVASSRIVTTGAVFFAAGICLLVALA